MNSRYSNNIFKYNNKKFTFFVNLFVGEKDDDLNVSLDMIDVEEFVYENKINSLCIGGHIIYTDRYAQVDKFLNQHFAYCNVLFCENKQKNDGGFVVEQLDDERKFNHTFIITSISVISRNQNVIKYKINLISNNWFKCRANVHFSNYGIEKQSIFEILKNCISTNGLVIDKETFGKVTTAVALKYASNSNDTLFTVLKYLLHKLYYYDQLENAIKFLIYDETTDKYRLFDITDKQTATGIYNTVFSFFKTNAEALIQQEPTNIGYMTSTMPKTDIYGMQFDYEMHDYSYDTNEFSTYDFKQDATLNYMNNRYDTEGYQDKFYSYDNPEAKCFKYGSYWDNDQDIYFGSLDALQKNNALVLNITGEILRKPGSLLTIALDRSMKNATSENKKELDRLKRKYKAYEGLWVTSKVQHIICPNQQSYRQQIVIFRNYIPKIETPSTSQV